MTSTRFLAGKVPPDILSRVVFRYTGALNRRLVLGPALGEDAAIVRTHGKMMVLTSDPITGASENAGWLSVHVNANDVATRGAKPVWFLCCVLLPEGSDPKLLERIMSQVDEAAREISVTVAGGHSEITMGLDRLIVVGSMIGEIASGTYVTTSGAGAGDKVILTKTIGIEGTSILARELSSRLIGSVGEIFLRRAKAFSKRISVVKDATIAKRTGGVTAMHDPTEGGIMCALWELAEASKTGITIDKSSIPIAPETEVICRTLGVNPYRVLSSGALLISAKPRNAARIVNSLRRHGIDACVIGEMTPSKSGRSLVKKDGTRVRIEPPGRDEIYRILSESGGPFS